MSAPTQVSHPWRATIRTTLAALAAVVVAAAPHAGAVDWSDTTGYGIALATVAFLTRALADERVERALRKAIPALAADPDADLDHEPQETTT